MQESWLVDVPDGKLPASVTTSLRFTNHHYAHADTLKPTRLVCVVGNAVKGESVLQQGLWFCLLVVAQHAAVPLARLQATSRSLALQPRRCAALYCMCCCCECSASFCMTFLLAAHLHLLSSKPWFSSVVLPDGLFSAAYHCYMLLAAD